MREEHRERCRIGACALSSNVDFADAVGFTGVNPDHPCAERLRILDAEAGLIERKRDKVAIIGYATSTRDLAPFDDPEWTICGLNQLYRMIPRADVWMDIHSNWDDPTTNVEGTDHTAWVRDCGIPVLMTKTYPNLPTSVAYPLDAVLRIGTDYLTSSVAYYIAWAVHQGYKEVALYGIDLVVGTEYETQKAAAEFWLGVAHGRGIDLRIPQQCALLKASHRYGYELEPSVGLIPLGDFAHREKALIAQRDQLMAKLNALDGAIHDVSQYETWKDDQPKRLAWLNEVKQETSGRLGAIDGAAQEVRFWHELLLLRSRGASVPIR